MAGVLKLYFRSLEPPLFPLDMFNELLASAGETRDQLGGEPLVLLATASLSLFSWAALATELEVVGERVEPVSHLLSRLPRPVLVVLRYLFTFLNQ